MLSFFDGLWKKENLVFLRFNDNLLALNQLLTFVSSLFIFSNKMLMSLCEKKRFVSSANMIGFSTFEAWCKSFTYNNENPKKSEKMNNRSIVKNNRIRKHESTSPLPLPSLSPPFNVDIINIWSLKPIFSLHKKQSFDLFFLINTKLLLIW